MASTNEPRVWETFLRRPSDLKEGIETALVLRDLNPGRRKYALRHVVAIVSRNPEEISTMDKLKVRTVVGVELPGSWGITILKDLPIELPGRPYHDFFAALRAGAENPDLDRARQKQYE